jgi:hypothetical protein
MNKIVILDLYGSIENGFNVRFEISNNYNRSPLVQSVGTLPPALELYQVYESWHLAYSAYSQLNFQDYRSLRKKAEFNSSLITKVELDDLYNLSDRLSQALNIWLNSQEFRSVKDTFLSKLSPSDEISVIIQTDDERLQRLPWHLWEIFKDYRKAEVSLGSINHQKVEIPRRLSSSLRNKVRILAVFGNDEGINLHKDQYLLGHISDDVDISSYEQPTRKQLNDLLWDKDGFDILYFSGHSFSDNNGKNGTIKLNLTESLNIEEIKPALSRAIGKGLKIAIFNSCDGLGLAQNLLSLDIPQIIVMREPVPDLVAHEFLEHFLKVYSNDSSLYLAFREARERLSILERKYPCSSWLPVLFHNSAEKPPSWQELCPGKKQEIRAKSYPSVPKSDIGFGVKFLWFCSGANIKVLEKCQVDQDKYASIGFTILLTFILASLSGGYTLWTVFNSTKMAISFGLLWGLMIGNLDRFLVSTTRKKEDWSVEQSVFLGVRVLVAISIAFVVAKPLELKIFEKSIRAELIQQNTKSVAENQTYLIKAYSEISQLQKDNQTLQNALDEWKQQRDDTYRAVLGEAEGISGTNKMGKGPLYYKKWQKYQQSLAEYENNKQNLDSQIERNLKRIHELTQKRDLEQDKIVTEKAKANDIMTQLETLDELGKKKPIYAWSSFFITLIFVLIDVSPIIAKLFLKRSLYDCLLDKEEETQLNLSFRSLNLGESHSLQQIEIQEKAQEEAINNAFQSENYQKAIDDLSKVYTNQLSREISRLGQEFNPSVYKHKIKQEIHKQMENKTIPFIVEEEVQHHQKLNKVEEAYQHTLDAMDVYLTNFVKNELPNEKKDKNLS